MKIKIKDSWKEVTIGEFIALEKIKGVQFNDNIELAAKLLEILSDKDAEFIANIPAENIPSLASHLSFITAQVSGGNISTTYVINGKEYNATLNVREFSSIRYIDLASLLRDNDGNKNLHNILAVILVPKGMKYNGGEYDIMQVANEIYEYFSIADAYALSLFFSKIFESLIEVIKNCSIKKIRKIASKEMNKERKEALMKMIRDLKRLQKNGAGLAV